MRSPLLGLLVLLATAAPSLAQRPGDWVLMLYKGGPYWFPGVIAQIGPRGVTVRYDDGDVETRTLQDVRPYDWRVGSRIECNWRGGGKWYAGRITRIENTRIDMAYDDGDRETTTTGRCRSR